MACDECECEFTPMLNLRRVPSFILRVSWHNIYFWSSLPALTLSVPCTQLHGMPRTAEMSRSIPTSTHHFSGCIHFASRRFYVFFSSVECHRQLMLFLSTNDGCYDAVDSPKCKRDECGIDFLRMKVHAHSTRYTMKYKRCILSAGKRANAYSKSFHQGFQSAIP